MVYLDEDRFYVTQEKNLVCKNKKIEQYIWHRDSNI